MTNDERNVRAPPQLRYSGFVIDSSFGFRYSGFRVLPVVLHHGLFGFGEINAGPVKLSYFGRIARGISGRGHPVILSSVHPTAGVATRARQLKETVLRQLEIIGRPKEKVIVVAHSMGGLDARYMISRLGMDDRVEALLTLAPPHRGSPFAD